MRKSPIRVWEYRVHSEQTHHTTMLREVWQPATLDRLVEELRQLGRLGDQTAVVEVRRRRPFVRRHRRTVAP
jgi:hypothetical protein